MAYTVRSYVRVDEAAARAMFFPGGQVHEWFRRNIQIPALAAAIAESPLRSGSLRAAHYGEMGSNQYGVWAYLFNSAEYATFVHEGTTGISGRIYPEDPSDWLAVGKEGLFPPILYTKSVATQSANPWMAEAMAQTLSAQGFPVTSGSLRRAARFSDVLGPVG